MNWQLAMVLAMIALSAGYLSWRSWRAWRRAAKGCSSGCGCAAPAQLTSAGHGKNELISSDSLKLRVRH